MAYYTYILKSKKDAKYFFGQTKNLKARLHYHNRGLGKTTRESRPWVLLAYAEQITRDAAMGLERRLRALTTASEVEKFIREHNFKKP